ncbi:MAG: hypothetical protein V3V05_10320 [Pontiella sp.]
MRLNRALDYLSTHLSRKGISSTAAALATAQPAHAALTAPSGLATSISTSILAGAGVVGLSAVTLTTTVLPIMKTKTLIIAASVAATAVVGTGIYTAGKTNPARGEDSSALPLQTPEPSVRPVNVIDSSTGIKTEEKMSDKSIQLTSLDESNSSVLLKNPPINPEALEKAEKVCAMMEASAASGIYCRRKIRTKKRNN